MANFLQALILLIITVDTIGWLAGLMRTIVEPSPSILDKPHRASIVSCANSVPQIIKAACYAC